MADSTEKGSVPWSEYQGKPETDNTVEENVAQATMESDSSGETAEAVASDGLAQPEDESQNTAFGDVLQDVEVDPRPAEGQVEASVPSEVELATEHPVIDTAIAPALVNEREDQVTNEEQELLENHINENGSVPATIDQPEADNSNLHFMQLNQLPLDEAKLQPVVHTREEPESAFSQTEEHSSLIAAEEVIRPIPAIAAEEVDTAPPAAVEYVPNDTLHNVAMLEDKLKLESKAREELEDMLLRIEKHFKAEQAARKKAEELLQAALNSEFELRCQLEDILKKRKEEDQALEQEREEVRRDRRALEGMRQDFEAELTAARAEVARAQDALHATEERVRAAELVERAKLEGQYQQRLQTMASQLESSREDWGRRAQAMAQEADRWRQQATMTAAAVMDAKNDVLERRKELDMTKEKMDRLVDKLYSREGALAAMPPSMPTGPQGRRAGGIPSAPVHEQYGMMSQYQMPPGNVGWGGPPQSHKEEKAPSKHSNLPRLPPVKSQSANTSPINSRTNGSAQDAAPVQPPKPAGRPKKKVDRFDEGKKKDNMVSAMANWF